MNITNVIEAINKINNSNSEYPYILLDVSYCQGIAIISLNGYPIFNSEYDTEYTDDHKAVYPDVRSIELMLLTRMDEYGKDLRQFVYLARKEIIG